MVNHRALKNPGICCASFSVNLNYFDEMCTSREQVKYVVVKTLKTNVKPVFKKEQLTE